MAVMKTSATSVPAVAAWVTVQRDEQVGCAVHHPGLLPEAGRAVDHSYHLQNLDDLVQVAKLRFHTGKKIKRAPTGCLIPLVH